MSKFSESGQKVTAPALAIEDARTDADFNDVRALFEEYAAWLGVDLSFQNFAHELAHVREVYAAPRSCLLLARLDGAIAGCGALRPFKGATCEMKRLYVRPSTRRMNVGRRLAETLIERAREIGYRRMVLDTLAHMQPARVLYRSLGFRETAPYYDNPLPGAVYMEVDLIER